MSNKNFLLLSLEDSKVKRVANVVSNDSCRKILDYLADNEATESELAEKLEVPISTVHYNLQQLMEAELITTEEFHYSEKGKEVKHYKLANKYIIITPKRVFGIKEKLKSILPVTLAAVATAGIIQLVTKYLPGKAPIATQDIMAARAPVQEKAMEAGLEAVPIAEEIIAENGISLFNNIALWFLLGALFAILVYILVSYIKRNST